MNIEFPSTTTLEMAEGCAREDVVKDVRDHWSYRVDSDFGGNGVYCALDVGGVIPVGHALVAAPVLTCWRFISLGGI